MILQPTTIYVVQIGRDGRWSTYDRTPNCDTAFRVAASARQRYPDVPVRVSAIQQTARGGFPSSYTLKEC